MHSALPYFKRGGLIPAVVSPPSLLSSAKCLVPSLVSGSRRKGHHGKVLVVGGSDTYAGAPLYTGMAALRTGADLVWVACSDGASLPIKAQSPELMVLGCIPSTVEGVSGAMAALEPILKRVHSLVVGPGLGRRRTAPLRLLQR